MDFEELGIKTRKAFISFIENLEKCRSVGDLDINLSSHQSQYIKKVMNDKRQTLQEVTRDVKSYLNTLKDIVIYTSIEPTESLSNTVVDLFSNKKNYLIDFKIDRNIIGGAKVSVDGKVYDATLRNKINKLLTR